MCLPSRKNIFFKFSSLLLELHRIEGVCKGLLLFEGERLISIFEEDVHVLIIRISYIISYIMLLVAQQREHKRGVVAVGRGQQGAPRRRQPRSGVRCVGAPAIVPAWPLQRARRRRDAGRPFSPACRRRRRRKQQRDAATGRLRRRQARRRPASALAAAVAAVDCGWHFVRGSGWRLSIVTQGRYL